MSKVEKTKDLTPQKIWGEKKNKKSIQVMTKTLALLNRNIYTQFEWYYTVTYYLH